MKLLITLAAVVAVAVAVPTQRSLVQPILAGAAPVVDEDQQPIIIGPAIIEQNPIAVGPAFIDFPLPDGGAVTAVESSPVVNPSPVIIGPTQPGAPAPLVQIIVNVNQGAAGVSPAPVITPEEIQPEPVIVVDNADNSDNIVDVFPVVDPVVPEAVIVETPVIAEPVQVVDVFPVVEPIVVEPVIVGTPIIPAPAVILPDILN